MEKMSFEEFEIEFWDYVSQKIVSRRYLREYDDFIASISFDMYYLYLKGAEIKFLGKSCEVFFSNMFKFNCSTQDLPEEIHISDY